MFPRNAANWFAIRNPLFKHAATIVKQNAAQLGFTLPPEGGVETSALNQQMYNKLLSMTARLPDGVHCSGLSNGRVPGL
jgi:hypothetical protein